MFESCRAHCETMLRAGGVFLPPRPRRQNRDVAQGVLVDVVRGEENVSHGVTARELLELSGNREAMGAIELERWLVESWLRRAQRRAASSRADGADDRDRGRLTISGRRARRSSGRRARVDEACKSVRIGSANGRSMTSAAVHRLAFRGRVNLWPEPTTL